MLRCVAGAAEAPFQVPAQSASGYIDHSPSFGHAVEEVAGRAFKRQA